MKIALVTGASSGIGYSVIENLLKSGWKVYGLSRRDPGFGDNFIWLNIDLGVDEQIDSLSTLITEKELGLLVSNAGIIFDELPTKVTKKSFDEMFSINVLAPMLIINTLKTKLNKSYIISVSSDSDRFPSKNHALYGSSKAANKLYFESLALELKNSKIFTLLPSYIDTPMLRELKKNSSFNFDEVVKPNQVYELIEQLISNKLIISSGSKIIVANNPLKEDFINEESLYGYNTDTGELFSL